MRVRESPKAEPLKPNLVALKANHLYLRHTSNGRELRFESGLGSVGRGPIEVRPDGFRGCPRGKQRAYQVMYRDRDGNRHYTRREDTATVRRFAGCTVYHPAHDHWHFQASARYSLYRPGNPRLTAAHRKMSFCLRDSERIPEQYGTWRYPVRYGECSRTRPQGISVGWVDIYQNFLPGQSLRLPNGVRRGRFCLRTKVDPTDALVETDDSDNVSLRAFRLRGDRISIIPVKPCLRKRG